MEGSRFRKDIWQQPPVAARLLDHGAAEVKRAAHAIRKAKPAGFVSLTPIPYAVAGQLVSYYVALRRGVDPDNPRGLTKVTPTR